VMRGPWAIWAPQSSQQVLAPSLPCGVKVRRTYPVKEVYPYTAITPDPCSAGVGEKIQIL